MTEYYAELLVDTGESINSARGKEIIEETIEDAEIEDSAEYDSHVVKKGLDPHTVETAGMLLIQGANTLISYYIFLQNSEDRAPGYVKNENGNYVSLTTVDGSVIENNDGTVIGNVEGDLKLFEMSGDNKELRDALRKESENKERFDY